ncbi:exonuclease domain-containing protein [Thioalkalivibrio sp.]|uniref:exonuclease domain-containing protein n=1 Tax=Thioalkalivibrio sp. TaxID=2093813 RepID=UPI0035616178
MLPWTLKRKSSVQPPESPSDSQGTSASSGDADAFIALDVETANADVASICQVGVAKYVGGELVDEWSSLVDPEDGFDPVNVFVHGIDGQRVAGSPNFRSIYEDLASFCNGQIVVSHTMYDRTAIIRASAKFGLQPLRARWLDSARVARRAWEQFAHRGYGLTNVCRTLGYTYQAHDALEDAKACGFVLLRAIEESGFTLSEWLERVERRIPWASDPSAPDPLRKIEGAPDGPLSGESIVFTGSLAIPRREAAELAASRGADVSTGVSKKTTMLVVGDLDVRTFVSGQTKSTKHRKAEELIRQGVEIRIIGESDFLELVQEESR